MRPIFRFIFSRTLAIACIPLLVSLSVVQHYESNCQNILYIETKHMRSIIFIASLVFSLGYTGLKAVGQTNKLNGTWIPLKQEIAGKELQKVAYEKQKLVIIDSNYIFTAESVDKGTVKYGNDDKMDIYGKDGVNAGKHFTAIYKLESEQLTICYNLAGDSYPESFETKSKPTLFLSVFTKQH